MKCRSADTGRLPDVTVLRQIASPRRLRPIAWAESEDPGGRIVRLVVEVTPFALAVRETRPGLEQEDVEPSLRKLDGFEGR